MNKTKRLLLPPRGSAAYPPYRFKQILDVRGDVHEALKQLIEEETAYWRGVAFCAELQKRIGVPSQKESRVK
jgi:hypothetical protein